MSNNKSPLDVIGAMINTTAVAGKAMAGTGSITDVAKLTSVEPLTIISKDCLNLEYLPDIQGSLLSIFIGYYLQAVSILSQVKDVEVIRTLDKLNPNRNAEAWLLESSQNIGQESFKYSLPIPGVVSLEEQKKETLDSVVTLSNLSVGKLVNVSFGVNGMKDPIEQYVNKDKPKAVEPNGNYQTSLVTIPIQFRLMASSVSNDTIAHILTFNKEDVSFIERFHAWRSGRISGIKDLIFCQDLIDEQKKAIIEDKTGTLEEIIRRVNNSKTYGLLTKNPSMAASSNIFVISEEVAKNMELKLGGKLSSKNIRDRAFENTYAMIIAIIDREWERVTFYVRNQAKGSDFSIKEIKAGNKGKGPDITDILKSFNMGTPMSF